MLYYIYDKGSTSNNAQMCSKFLQAQLGRPIARRGGGGGGGSEVYGKGQNTGVGNKFLALPSGEDS